MANNDLILRTTVEGADKAVKEINKVAAGTEEASERISKIGEKLKTGAAVIGTAAFASAIVVDEAFDEVIKLTGATGDALESLNNSFNDVARRVPASMDSIGAAVGEINTRLGLVGGELTSVTESFLKFADVNNVEVKSAVANVTRLMGDWGVASTDANLLLDKLTAASQATGISIDDLSVTAVNYGVQLRALGFNLDQSIALLSKFEKEGVSTEKIVSGLSIALGRLAEAGIDDTGKAFEELIKGLKDTTSVGEATREAIEILGMRAGPDFALAVKEGRFEYQDYLAVIESSSGILEQTYQNTLGFSESVLQLKNNFALLSATLLDAPLEYVNNQLGKINESIKARSDLSNFMQSSIDMEVKKYEELQTAILLTSGANQEFFVKYAEAQRIGVEADAMFMLGQERKSQKLRDTQVKMLSDLAEWKDQNKLNLDGAILDSENYANIVASIGESEAIKRAQILDQMQIKDFSVRQAILTAAGTLTAEQIRSTISLKTQEKEALAKLNDDIKVSAVAAAQSTTTDIVAEFSAMIKKLQNLWNSSKSGFKTLNLLVSVGSSLVGAVKSKAVNDAIISPKGDIITTHPDDYIIATKNPSSLGGGGNYTVNISGVFGTDAADVLGDMIVQRIKRVSSL